MKKRIGRKFDWRVQLKRIEFRHEYWLRVIVLGSILLSLFISLINFSIRRSYDDKIFNDTNSLSGENVAIIFGSAVKSDNTASEILNDRVLAALDLYKASKIQRFLISGNSEMGEIQAMQRILEENNIPDFLIDIDDNSYRTFDTCINAKKDFDINSAILITQEFHLARALYLCNSLGINSVGYTADKRIYKDINRLEFRENFAIIKSILDVGILRPSYE